MLTLVSEPIHTKITYNCYRRILRKHATSIIMCFAYIFNFASNVVFWSLDLLGILRCYRTTPFLTLYGKIRKLGETRNSCNLSKSIGSHDCRALRLIVCQARSQGSFIENFNVKWTLKQNNNMTMDNCN